MHIVITGAAGFVGRALAKRLQQSGHMNGKPITRLSLLDLHIQGDALTRCQHLVGDIGDARWLRTVLGQCPVDVVFHLASIPGGTAEQQYALARLVNLDATQSLLEIGQRQVEQGGTPPVFVFASSIAVFGSMTAAVDDDTQPRPQMTYGVQKLIGELLVADFSRRGWIDGRAVRIPGVLARPAARTGQLSAFMSDIIRELAAGRPFVCPTSPQATTWASSLPCVVDQLLHAATFDVNLSQGKRVLTLPTLRFAMSELAAAIGRVHGRDVEPLLRYEPDERIEALFGRFPGLTPGLADQAGFGRDRDIDELVLRALPDGEPKG
jgi:nucleoside-diphosphate-sugar epimerase